MSGRPQRVTLRLALVAVLAGTAGFDLLHTDNRNVARGNELLRTGKAKEALAAYDQAQKRLPDDPGVRYDRGLALAELGQLEEAQRELGRATESRDPTLKSRAHFNLGNAYARQEKWREAVESYKRALAADPRYFDAKWNLELALRKLKEQEEKQKQEQQKKQEEQQKQQEQQKKQEEEQKKQQEQQQGQDGGTPQPQPDQQKQQQEQQQQQQEQKKQQEQQQQQQPKPQPDQAQEQPQPEPKTGGAQDQARPQPQATRREAVDTVLDALEKNEKNLPLERLRLRARRRPERDW